MSSYDVVVKIIADGKKAVAEFDRAGKAADRMAKKTHDDVEKSRISMEKFGRQAAITGTAMVGAAGTVAFAMSSWVKSAQESERAQMQLESSVKGAYGASSNAVKAFNEQAKAIQKVTVASDEDVNSIQAMLVQFGLTRRQVTTLTPLVVDIARKWGIDYVSAAKAVEKAAAGKTAGLKKLGIQVDETKAKTDPYIATVTALRKAAGGFAEQEGKTFAGQTAILKNQVDELKESLGRGVLSVLTDMLPAVNNVAGAFTSLDDKTGGLIGRSAALGTGFTALIGGAALVSSAVIKIRATYDEAAASSERFALAQKGVGIAVAAIAGYVIGSSIVDAVTGWGKKVDEGVKKAIGANTARGAFEEFNKAATAQASKESSGFLNLGKGIGAMVVQGVSFGSARLYENLDNKWKRAAFEKTFQKVMATDPTAASNILRYIAADDKRHAAFTRMGIDLAKYRKELQAVYDTNKNGRVEGIEKVQFRADSIKDVHTYIDAVTGAQDAQMNFVRATLSAKDAVDGVKDAEKNLVEARKGGDKTKIAEAQGQLAAAYLSVADANRQVQEAAIKNAEAQLDLQNLISDPKKFEESIDHWGDLVKVMGKDSPVGKAIQDRIDDWVLMAYTTGQPLQLNDATVLTALADLRDKGRLTQQQLEAINQKWQAGQLDTSGVDTPLDKLIAKFTNFNTAWQQFWANMPGTGPSGAVNPYIPPAFPAIGTNPPTSPTRFVSHARASGGPVAGSMPYLVGEKGPELFVPTGNGMIVPNGNLGAMRATGTGAVVNINVAAGPLATPAETGAAVLDALKAYERRNGALPLKVA